MPSSTPPNSSKEATGAGTPRRRRRTLRWCLRIIVGTPILIACAALIVMRSPMIGRLVAEQVRHATGGELTAERAVITLNGQLLLTDLRLRVPGLDGPEGEALSASQAIADIEWRRLPPVRWFIGPPPGGAGSGSPVTVLRLTDPVFRLSQSSDDGSINISGLTPQGGGTGRPVLPRIDVIDGRVEFAEHSASRGSFDLLNAVEVGGSLLPGGAGDQGAPEAGAGSPTLRISLQETGRAPSVDGEQRGMILDGHVDLARGSASLRLLYVSLDAWPPESVPEKFRKTWRNLALQGQIEETRFDYAAERGMSVSVKVKDVSIVVPVPAENEADEDGFLSLSGVDGLIGLAQSGLTAELVGRIERQTGLTTVSLATRGLDLNSGFRCELSGRGLNVSRNPEFLPYVPPIVRQYLEWFGGPTADVDARVVIERGDPVNGQAAEIAVPDGGMTFRNGRAAFHKFPYPFRDMAGEVRFDDRTIRMIKITGVGPSGSPLKASGIISPLTPDSQVDVKIEVDDVPLDDDLLAAMQPAHRRLTEIIFSRDRWLELVRAGLVRDPAADPGPAGDGSGAGGGSGVVGETEPAPEFEFGGSARIRVHVQRPLGDEVDWTTDVNVSFRRAGLVPEPFPFPIVARDLELSIHDDRAVLDGGTFAGLRGGEAQVQASVVFGGSAAGSAPTPDVRITALDVPVDPLLLNAVPGEQPPPAPSPDPSTDLAAQPPLDAKAILNNLDLRGVVDCRVLIREPEAAVQPQDPELIGPPRVLDVDYSVVVGLDNLTAAPAGVSGSGLCVRRLSGELTVTPRGVSMRGLSAGLGRLGRETDDGQLPPWERRERFASAAPAGEMRIDLEAEAIPRGNTDQGRLDATVEVLGLDVSDPIEDMVAVFSAPAARYFRELRRARDPSGRLDARITLEADRAPAETDGAERPVEIGIAIGTTDGLSVNSLGGRLSIDAPTGAVTITTAGRAAPGHRPIGTRIHFHRLGADLRFNGGSAGRLAMDGGLVIGDGAHPVHGPADLACDLSGWRFEGGLTESIMREFGGAQLVERYQRLAPQGSFDARIELAAGERESDVGVIGSMSPRSLRVVHGGVPIEFTEIAGRLTFESPPPPSARPGDAGERRSLRGRLEGGRVATDAWSAEGTAEWIAAHGGLVTLDTSFDADIVQLDPALRSILPSDVGAASDRLDLTFAAPLRLREGRLSARVAAAQPAAVRAPNAPDPVTVNFTGQVAFDQLGLRLDGSDGDDAARAAKGLRITEASGVARVRAGPGDATPDGTAAEPFVADFALSGLRFAGVAMTDGRARLSRSAAGTIRLGDASAACHRGRVIADIVIDPGEHRTYRVNTLMAGVNFAPLLEDMARSVAPSITAEPPDPGRAAIASTDATRGNVDARLSLTGTMGDDLSRRGSGAIRIANGDVVRLPLILPLMQMSNLVLPLGDRLNFLTAAFYIDGSAATFDDVRVCSDSISIVGGGTITLPDLALDMRFNTRANRRVPLWSDLFEAVRNEIASTVVTGTIEDPVIRAETLSSTRRAIGEMIDPE